MFQAFLITVGRVAVAYSIAAIWTVATGSVLMAVEIRRHDRHGRKQ